MSKNATIAVILYTSKTLANGEHPIMLRATKERKRKYVSLGLSCPLNFWDEKRQSPKHNHPDRLKIAAIISNKLEEYRTQILTLNMNSKDYTADTLVEQLEKPTRTVTVWTYFQETIAAMKAAEQIRNAQVYKESFSKLKTYYGKKDLLFSDIDVRWLNQYENWLRSHIKKETTLSFHFRTLRALYNKARSEKLIPKEPYPFDDFKVSKFSLETQKRAISKEEMLRIINLELSPKSSMWFAQQVFVFSYLAQGININDLAKLQWRDIRSNRIYYIRSKTKQAVNVALSTSLSNIIDNFKSLATDKDQYIFPILDKNLHITPTQINNRIQKITKQVNQNLKEIATLADVNVELTTYVARHTYATVLKKGGANIAKISQALAHTDLKTTEIYLKSFEDEEIDKMNEELLL